MFLDWMKIQDTCQTYLRHAWFALALTHNHIMRGFHQFYLKESVKHTCPLGICSLDCFTAGGEMPTYCCSLTIWSAWSYEPGVIMLGLYWEELHGAVPMIVSAKGFLAFTTNLPTHCGKRKGKLDSIENRNFVQRVAELEAGAGIRNTNLWLCPCHFVCIKPAHQL